MRAFQSTPLQLNSQLIATRLHSTIIDAIPCGKAEVACPVEINLIDQRKIGSF
jgi:hypothetical protein